MHDVLSFEKRGLRSAALVSDEFQKQAMFQGYQIGAKDPTELFRILVWVPHPISDQTVAQMQHKADTCFSTVVQALKTGIPNEGFKAAVAQANDEWVHAGKPTDGDGDGDDAEDCKT
mmetsp:Transcript_26525/g.47016  ORF Transcript_26525/g.47016 Transcript_26525/m.47016 type:complete len:117 (-) Transcript_26525:584-934(-)